MAAHLRLDTSERNMAGYVILDIQLSDPETFARYKNLAPPAIAA